MTVTIEEPLVSQPMRPVDTLERPSFEVPPGACDVHMHAFGPLETYPCVPHPHYTLPDGTLAQYRDMMDALEIDRFVIVQPSFYDTDNSCLLEVLREAGSGARGVVMIDLDFPHSELEHYHSLGVRGVRLDLFKRSHVPLEDIKSYILAMSDKVTPLGWHLQFYAPGWLIRDLIDFLATLEIDYVIDHMGYMLEEDGLTEADFDRLLDLMTSGNCWLKLSAPYRIAKKRGYSAVEGIAKAIVAAAPGRAIWGTDWPHIPDSGRDSGELLNLLALWAPDPSVRQQILVDNPARLFGFSADATSDKARQ